MSLPYQFGVNQALLRFPSVGNVALIASLGARWARVDAPWLASGTWPGTEPTLGAYSAAAAAAINALKADCASHSMKLLLPVTVGGGGGGFAASGRTAADYAAMMAWLVGQCPGLAWEILNEPDLNGTSGAVYAGVCQAAYPAMKAADPTCTVVAGVIAVPQTSTFMTAAYAAGIKGFYDALSIHTYDQLSSYAGNYDPGHHLVFNVNVMRTLMTTNTDSAPLWITEFGWDSYPEAGGVTLSQQAVFTTTWLQQIEALSIPVVMSYNLVDNTPPNWGLVQSTTLALKPVYYAIQNLVSGARLVKVGALHYRRR